MVTFCILDAQAHSAYWMHRHILHTGCTGTFCILDAQAHSEYWMHRHILHTGCAVTFCILDAQTHSAYWMHRHILHTGCAGTFCILDAQTHSVYLSISRKIHKEISNKVQQCIKMLLFHIYMKLNMFRATHRPSSGVQNCTDSLWLSFIYIWNYEILISSCILLEFYVRIVL